MFSDVDIGAPDPNRVLVIVLFVRASTNPALSGLTVDGQAATVLFTDAGGTTGVWVAYIPYPTGSAADIEINVAQTSFGRRVSVYRVLANDPVPADFETVTAGTTKSITLTDGEVGIFATRADQNASSVSAYTNATQDVDYRTSTSNRALYCGRINDPSLAFSATFSTATSALFGACWA